MAGPEHPGARRRPPREPVAPDVLVVQALRVGEPRRGDGEQSVGPRSDVDFTLVEVGTGLAVDLADLVIAAAGRREPLRRSGNRHDRLHRLGHRPDEEAALLCARADEHVDVRRVAVGDELGRRLVPRHAVDDREQDHRHREIVAEQHSALEHRQLRAHLDEPLHGHRPQRGPVTGLHPEQLEHRASRRASRSRARCCGCRRPIGGSRAGRARCALGVPMRVPTLIPPADSPKIVTFPGSPPNAAMLSRTHSRARDLIEDAEVAGALARPRTARRGRGSRARAADS